MDIVITYVDGNDPVWKKDYGKYTDVPVMDKRFRDWGTLKYILRGIEVNMPFIRKIHLVVSHPSQVPQWVDTEHLDIVLHRDIIPEEYLPTFNSATIEMFLHKIEDLDEEFIYFNDDLYPLDKSVPEDFFRDGKGVLGFRKHYLSSGMFKKICRNSDRYARKALGMKPGRYFVRPQHTCTPMFRSECECLYSTLREDICRSLSRTRTEDNVSQYLYLDYQYYKGRMIAERLSNRHFSVALATPERLYSFIMNPSSKIMCVNDVHLSESKYLALKSSMIDAFEKKFPNKSKFEK